MAVVTAKPEEVRRVTTRPEEVRSLVSKEPGILSRFLQQSGPEIIGAIGGGIAGAPFGPPGIVGGGMLGAAGAESLDQLIRRLLGQPSPETSLGAAGQIAEAATGGALQEAGPVARSLVAGTKALQTQRLLSAAEFGLPLTKGQATPGSIREALESFIGSTVLGRATMRSFKLTEQVPILNREIEQFINQVSKSRLSSEQAGELLAGLLNKSKERVGEMFAEEVKAIAREVPKAAIRPPAELFSVAQKMLDNIKLSTDEFTSLLGVESLKKAVKILEDFSAGHEIPLSKAVELRKLLFKVSEAAEVDIGKGSIKKLNQALTKSMGDVLEQQGRPDLFQRFLDASHKFRFVSENLEKKGIQQILISLWLLLYEVHDIMMAL